MNAPTTRRRALPALLALLAAMAVPAGAQERIVVFPEAGTPVIATEILVVAGPANEPQDRPGIAHLAARSVIRPIEPMLDSLGARVSVEVEKDAISFTLISAPDVWEEASRLLMVALFRDPPSGPAVQAERAAIRAELVARQANPADAVAREADRAFFGRGHPWGRPTVGTVASLDRLSFGDVADFLTGYLTSDRALAVVVGPVERQAAIRHLESFMVGRGRLPLEAPPTLPEPRPVRVDYNSITTWVSASFPFGPAADEEALRLLAHLLVESLTTGAERHLVYNASAVVVPRAGGGELRLQAVTPPRSADRMAGLITETLRGLGSGTIHDDVWETHLRRYRGERLQSLSSPEARAHEVARRLLASEGQRWLLPELATLTQERLVDAIRALGTPALVFLGPSLD
jgi:predicted Zn-dependent peptidase